MNEALTVIERNNLVELESVIQKNLTAFYEVGFALMQIRDNRLYREIYGTFEEYCKEKWGFTKSRANQLISASEVADNLTTTVAKEIPERHLRPLTSLPPEEQREVYQKAVETAPDGKVTAKHVEETVSKMNKKGYIYTETYPVSDAMAFVTMAITQLERIRPNDPKRKEALLRMIRWAENKIKER